MGQQYNVDRLSVWSRSSSSGSQVKVEVVVVIAVIIGVAIVAVVVVEVTVVVFVSVLGYSDVWENTGDPVDIWDLKSGVKKCFDESGIRQLLMIKSEGLEKLTPAMEDRKKECGVLMLQEAVKRAISTLEHMEVGSNEDIWIIM